MTLGSYLVKYDKRISQHGKTCRRVARVLLVSPYYLEMVARGHKQLSPKKAALLELATNQEVVRRSMWPTFPWEVIGKAA